MRINLILLASGNSKRFNGNKLLTNFNNKPLYMHTLDKIKSIKGLNKVIVVTKYDEIKSKSINLGFDVVLNQDSDLGISNSIILKYLLYLILTIIIAIIRHTDIKATIAIPILFNTLSIHPSPCLYNIFFIHLHYAHHNFSHNNNHQFYYKAGCPVFI